MATENVSYGWQGKIARVNLTTGEITTQSTDPYKYFLGGMGMANKIMYDEVPAGTDPFSPESKVVMAVGPLTASGVPLAGRTTFSHLSTYTTDHLVVDSHCGGMIGAKLKLAGWDGLIIEGASDKPVYIKILDDKITIEEPPKTGDNSNMGLWFGLLVLSCLGMVGTVIYGRRRRREDAEV